MAIHRTRFYTLENGETKYEPMGDVEGFIPNIGAMSIININGGCYRVRSIMTDIDIKDDFVIQTVLLKQE